MNRMIVSEYIRDYVDDLLSEAQRVSYHEATDTRVSQCEMCGGVDDDHEDGCPVPVLRRWREGL